MGAFQSRAASWLNALIQTVRAPGPPPTARRAARCIKFNAGTRDKWKGSTRYSVPAGSIASRSATPDAPSATPISTTLRLPRACLWSAWCSAAVCCAIGRRRPVQAKKGCLIARAGHPWLPPSLAVGSANLILDFIALAQRIPRPISPSFNDLAEVTVFSTILLDKSVTMCYISSCFVALAPSISPCLAACAQITFRAVPPASLQPKLVCLQHLHTPRNLLKTKLL